VCCVGRLGRRPSSRDHVRRSRDPPRDRRRRRSSQRHIQTSSRRTSSDWRRRSRDALRRSRSPVRRSRSPFRSKLRSQWPSRSRSRSKSRSSARRQSDSLLGTDKQPTVPIKSHSKSPPPKTVSPTSHANCGTWSLLAVELVSCLCMYLCTICTPPRNIVISSYC